jgi:hypothetical protein
MKGSPENQVPVKEQEVKEKVERKVFLLQKQAVKKR